MRPAKTSFYFWAVALAMWSNGSPTLAPAQGPPGAALPDPAPKGATVLGEGITRHVVFRTWAPNANHVAVSGDFNGWKEQAMQREPTRPGYWTLDSRSAKPDQDYRFVLDGLRRRDPHARAVDMNENIARIVDPRDRKSVV